MNVIVAIAAALALLGIETAAAQPTELATAPSPSFGTNPTARSVTVYDWRFYKADAEPFIRSDPVEAAPAEADALAKALLLPRDTIVENCAMLPAGNGRYRHPRSVEDRRRANCLVYGYTPDTEPSFALPRPVAKARPAQRGKGRRRR